MVSGSARHPALVYSSGPVAHMAVSVPEYSGAGCHVNIRRFAQNRPVQGERQTLCSRCRWGTLPPFRLGGSSHPRILAVLDRNLQPTMVAGGTSLSRPTVPPDRM